MNPALPPFLVMCLLAFQPEGAAQSLSVNNDLQGALDVHNAARTEVGVAPLNWDDALAQEAEAYAQELARRHRFEHDRDRNGHGENLYWYSASTNTPMSDASKSWYDEIEVYRYRRCCGPNFSETGHYTQMIWHSTTAVGIGVAVSSRGETYVVARYNPTGNWQGEYPYPKR
ncbi:MAG: CAP family protein [Flavobacteriales bacterium]